MIASEIIDLDRDLRLSHTTHKTDSIEHGFMKFVLKTNRIH
jgi:hypothetical protein